MKAYVIIFISLMIQLSFIEAQSTIEIKGDEKASMSAHHNTSSPSVEVGVNQQLGGFLSLGIGKRLDFNYNNIKRMSLSPTGQIAIGTETYKDKIYVKGQIRSRTNSFYHNFSKRAEFYDDNFLQFGLFGFGKIRFLTSSDKIAMTLHGPNLGIGIDNPTTLLHVQDRTITGSPVDVMAIGKAGNNPMMTLATGQLKNSMSIEYQRNWSDDNSVESGALVISDPSEERYMTIDNDLNTYIGRRKFLDAKPYTLSIGEDLRVEEYIILTPLSTEPGVCGVEFFFPASYYDLIDHKLKVCHSRSSNKWLAIH